MERDSIRGDTDISLHIPPEGLKSLKLPRSAQISIFGGGGGGGVFWASQN